MVEARGWPEGARRVRAALQAWGLADRVVSLDASTCTTREVAQAVGVRWPRSLSRWYSAAARPRAVFRLTPRELLTRTAARVADRKVEGEIKPPPGGGGGV